MNTATTPTVQKRYYTPREFATLTGISLSQVYAKMQTGDIMCVCPFGPRRIPRAWADQYLDEVEKQTREDIDAQRIGDPALSRRGRVR
jgi:predicted DNA-binding transcriptional regulator AlpA